MCFSLVSGVKKGQKSQNVHIILKPAGFPYADDGNDCMEDELKKDHPADEAVVLCCKGLGTRNKSQVIIDCYTDNVCQYQWHYSEVAEKE